MRLASATVAQPRPVTPAGKTAPTSIHDIPKKLTALLHAQAYKFGRPGLAGFEKRYQHTTQHGTETKTTSLWFSPRTNLLIELSESEGTFYRGPVKVPSTHQHLLSARYAAAYPKELENQLDMLKAQHEGAIVALMTKLGSPAERSEAEAAVALLGRQRATLQGAPLERLTPSPALRTVARRMTAELETIRRETVRMTYAVRFHSVEARDAAIGAMVARRDLLTARLDVLAAYAK